jgi:predicted nuclease of predicted toxin-antitoxin system
VAADQSRDREVGRDRASPLVWIDAQLPPSLARWLRQEHGADAAHVQDLGLEMASDRQIFEAAARPGIVMVTKDSDFVVLSQQRGPPLQVVWVRSGNATNRELRRVVLGAWAEASALLGAGEPLVEIRPKPGAG